jgi:hypothetical protein
MARFARLLAAECSDIVACLQTAISMPFVVIIERRQHIKFFLGNQANIVA